MAGMCLRSKHPTILLLGLTALERPRSGCAEGAPRSPRPVRAGVGPVDGLGVSRRGAQLAIRRRLVAWSRQGNRLCFRAKGEKPRDVHEVNIPISCS